MEADAHDLLQEALVEAWQRGNGGPPDDALVFATIRRRAIDLARRDQRRARRESTTQETAWFQPADESATLDGELAEAVKALPAHLREVVILKVWSELTFQQIADTLGIPLNTAASRYRYAVEQLRDLFKEARS